MSIEILNGSIELKKLGNLVPKALDIEVQLLTSNEKEDEDEKTLTCKNEDKEL